MNYITFREELIKKISESLSGKLQGREVSTQIFRKNNGIMREALVVQGEDSPFPNIYLKEFFEEHRDGKTMEDIVGSIAEIYENRDQFGKWREEISQYEKVKENLTVMVCNAERNAEQLTHVPHERREDLALVYRIRHKLSDRSAESILVDNQLLDRWGIGEQALKEDAWKSMKKKNPPSFQSEWQILDEILFGRPGGDLGTVDIPEGALYILNNQDGQWGAVYMFDKETMSRIAEKFGSNLIVLPSSIHETFIFPEREEVEAEGLQAMVRSINATVVEPEQILSDQVYRFDKETQEISILQPPEQTMGMSMNL